MQQALVQIALVVADYDEAIRFYTEKLHFSLIEDTRLSETKRWVVVAPPGAAAGCRLLLAQAANDAQQSRVGKHRVGQPVRGHLGQPPKEDTEDHHGEEWLHHRPSSPKYGLLVSYLDVAPPEEEQQDSIVSEVCEAEGD